MKKTLIIIICIFYIINVKALEINSNNAILYNLNDNKIIYEKNSTENTKIASLTKIMTTIIAIENISDIKQKVIIPPEAFKDLDGYVKAGFKPNEEVTYEDLLYGIMLPSGAECANAIAIKIAGNIEEFVDMMNKKAKTLNLNNTHFSNPIGKDEDNYSTVKDTAEILKYAIKNETFKKIFTTKKYIATNKLILESTILEKASKYNLDSTNILGAKTGFTDEAGFCLASISTINNINYLLVTTKADTNKPNQLIDAINIYDYYSKNYSYKKILSYNQELKTIPIKGSYQKEYKVNSNLDKYEYLNNNINQNDLVYEYEGIQEITKNQKENDYIGKINIKYNDEILYSYDIKLNKKIYYHNYIIYSIILVLLLILIKKVLIKIIY